MTRTRSSASISRVRNGRHRSRSTGVGLFAGGAQRFTAVTYAPCNASPSSRAWLVGWFASPALCIEA